jgi:predicted MPP superfamily phosphohydrolase
MVLAAGLIWSIIEPHLLTLRSYTVTSSKLPAQFDGFSIALIADLHAGSFGGLGRLDKAARLVEREGVDLILLGGDYISRGRDSYTELFTPLSDIAPSHGVFAVSGNHDHRHDYRGVIEGMRQAGVVPLEDNGVLLEPEGGNGPSRGGAYAAGPGLQILGVPDLWYHGFSDGTVRRMAQPEAYRVLLSHNPDYLVENSELYDLGLAGHTHGGQITLFGLWAPFLPVEHKAHWKGMEDIDGKPLIISNGVGVVGLPMRFFARPDVTVVELRRRNRDDTSGSVTRR